MPARVAGRQGRGRVRGWGCGRVRGVGVRVVHPAGGRSAGNRVDVVQRSPPPAGRRSRWCPQCTGGAASCCARGGRGAGQRWGGSVGRRDEHSFRSKGKSRAPLMPAPPRCGGPAPRYRFAGSFPLVGRTLNSAWAHLMGASSMGAAVSMPSGSTQQSTTCQGGPAWWGWGVLRCAANRVCIQERATRTQTGKHVAGACPVACPAASSADPTQGWPRAAWRLMPESTR